MDLAITALSNAQGGELPCIAITQKEEICVPLKIKETEEAEKINTYFQSFLQLGEDSLQYCKENPKKMMGFTLLIGGTAAACVGPVLTTLMITKAATAAGGALTALGGAALLFYDKIEKNL